MQSFTIILSVTAFLLSSLFDQAKAQSPSTKQWTLVTEGNMTSATYIGSYEGKPMLLGFTCFEDNNVNVLILQFPHKALRAKKNTSTVKSMIYQSMELLCCVKVSKKYQIKTSW